MRTFVVVILVLIELKYNYLKDIHWLLELPLFSGMGLAFAQDIKELTK